jgi:hypothetical protein
VNARLPAQLHFIVAAPDGIRKLRGLILELAVRGKAEHGLQADGAHYS